MNTYETLCGIEPGNEEAEFKLLEALCVGAMDHESATRLLLQASLQYRVGDPINMTIGLCTVIGLSHTMKVFAESQGVNVPPPMANQAVFEDLDHKEAGAQKPALQRAIFKLACMINETGDTLAAALTILGFYLLRSGKAREFMSNETDNETTETQEEG